MKLLAECPNPFILAGDGQSYVNPSRKIIDTARGQMARLRRELPSAAAPMTEFKRRLLLEIQRRHLALANVERPGAGWSDQLEHGPLFSAAQWFKCENDDAERMRWQRTLTALADDGLIVVDKANGCKWPKVKLTPEGGAIVEVLAPANGAS